MLQSSSSPFLSLKAQSVSHSVCSTCAKSYPFVQFKYSVYGRSYRTYSTYTRVSQCSHASVGLAQARPNDETKLHTASDQKPEPGKAWERGYHLGCGCAILTLDLSPDQRGKPKDTAGQTESLICAKSKELAVWRCMRRHLPILPG